MTTLAPSDWQSIHVAREAALEVLLHNANGPDGGLPRVAGWGYPEPYTRDLMIVALGSLASGNATLVESLRNVLKTLAKNQTAHGHIPSLANNPRDLGASDTTPLFLIGLALFRLHTGETKFLATAARKALTWLKYQSPGDELLVSQQPTSDWRDEQWVLGHGLFVNALVYMAYHLHDRHEQADALRKRINHILWLEDSPYLFHQSGQPDKIRRPYYALWAYKIYCSHRFDLLGNSLAIISGIASPDNAKRIINWVERHCGSLREAGLLGSQLPPNLFPYILPQDADWHPRYAHYNPPGHYHNGGIWPFIAGFYVTALVAAGEQSLAEQKLLALTDLVRPALAHEVKFGFNEWFRAQDGLPAGQDWQSWSAAMYLYAAYSVEQKQTPLLKFPVL